MLSPSPTQSYPGDSLPTANTSSLGESQGTDFVKVLWRWKWMAIILALLGGGLGYLQFTRMPPTYRSWAMVQVVYPTGEAAGLETLEGADPTREQSRLDESRIIKSVRVVNLAIEKGSLSEHKRLEGMSRDEIRDWILNEDRLEVEPAGRDSSTALIEISFVCEDADLCRQVVDALIAGYDSYLESAYKALGDDVVKIVSDAQDNLKASYDKLAEEHALFRQDSELIWLGDEARNQYAENNVEINAAINQINIESQKLQAMLQQIDEARRSRRPAESILLMLSTDDNLRESLLMDTAKLMEEPSEQQPQMLSDAQNALPFSSVERRRALMDLQMREQELLDSVGEGHPSVAAIRRRIQLYQTQIATLADTERRLESQQLAAAPEAGEGELTADEKLELWTNSLLERLSALSKQGTLLAQLADDNEDASKALDAELTKSRLLSSELASTEKLLDSYTEALQRMQILPSNNRRTLETLSPAEAGDFYGPKWIPYVLGGAALGFALICGLGVTVDWLDQSFRAPDEISSTLGLPILGHVPQMPLSNREATSGIDPAVCTYNGLFREANESYRAIRTSLYFSDKGQQHRVIQVTSPTPGDGKSTLATNLAVSIAQSGRSVLLMDADMRRPRVAKLFGLQNTSGIGEVIMGHTTLEDATVSTPIKNLSVLASSRPTPNPSELVSHQRFQDALDRVRDQYDYVIVDTPPVLAVADACAVAARVDGVLITLRLRRDSKPSATQAAGILKSIGAHVLGVIVNGVTGSEGYQYGYRTYGYEGHQTLEANQPIPVPPATQGNLVFQAPPPHKTTLAQKTTT